MSGMDEWPGEAAFGWIGDTWDCVAACVTFVEDDDVARVAAAFGGRMDHAFSVQGVRPLEEALAFVSDQIPGTGFGKGLPVALFVRRGGWVMAFEDNGGEGIRAEVLERVARGSRAVSVYWNVNMLTCFAFADTGQVVATFSDGALGSAHGADPGCIEDALDGLAWDSGLGAMFALAARLTGQVFTPEWLEGEFVAVPLVRWPRRGNADGRLLHPELDEELGEALRSADEERLRRATFAAARHAVTIAGIADHPVIAEALASWPRRPALLERMAQPLGSQPARLYRPPIPAPGPPGPVPGPPPGPAPRARAVDQEAMRRLRGYPDGVSHTSPGHALAVQALMRATEPGPPAITAYRTIKCADEVRQDLEQDVKGLREVVLRAFAGL
ncbi:DUF6461 domain-containing protein [Spirillospora sp. CA-255316]